MNELLIIGIIISIALVAFVLDAIVAHTRDILLWIEREIIAHYVAKNAKKHFRAAWKRSRYGDEQ